MKDWYAILGLEAGCTLADIEDAYSKLQARYQPGLDARDPYFEGRFNEIRQAYEVLSNPAARSRYDKQLNPALPNAADEKRRVKKYYSNTKGLNIGLTLVLGALLLVFGYHVIKQLSGAKAAKMNPAPVAVNTGMVHKSKRHKHRHWSLWAKTKPAAPVARLVKDTIKHAAAPALPVKTALSYNTPATYAPAPQTVEAEVHPPKITPAPPVPAPAESHAEPKPAYLYTTTIRANETGVVHMRRYDSFNADLIKTIPADAKVYVLERGNSYYKVMFENTVGYVPKWTVLSK